jgi:hypothetical protein
VHIYKTSNCSGAAVAFGSAADLASAGIAATVADDSTTTFHAVATNAFGYSSGCSSSSVTYREVSSPPSPFRNPTIKNATAPVVGTRLGKDSGSWYPSPTSYQYQWIRCDADGTSNCRDIGGATAPIYVPVPDDAGHTLRIRVVAHDLAGDSDPVTSAPSGTVAAKILVPVRLQAPVLSTTSPQVGVSMTTTGGKWTNSPTGHRYQWLRCDSSGDGCSAVTAESTVRRYTPVAGDAGHTLRVRVIATNAYGDSDPATSDPSGLVAG